MKGLTHFMTGVALSSFLTPAVTMAASTRLGEGTGAESSFILLLGGLYGIMPDTMDFKMGQFFAAAEVEVDCDPSNPDPKKMARQIGEAMDQVAETGEYRKVQLYPMQLASNLWRQYMIKFDGETNEVIVVMNEIVSTSQVPYPGTEPKENRVGRYKLKGKLLETHGRPSMVDIMSGPQFGFRKEGEHVVVEFLPWHRTWSHSYVLGAMLALIPLIIAYMAGLHHWYLYGLAAFLGFAGHLTEDLTGHMGGSLIWPIKAKRYDGFCMFRASNPHANFSVDFASVVIILHNLDRITTQVIELPWWLYYLYFLVIPMFVYHMIVKIFEAKGDDPKADGAVKAEAALELSRKADIQMEEMLFEDESGVF